MSALTVNYVSIPYPDFKLHEIIEPDEFDVNNDALSNKINEIVDVVNQVLDGVDSGSSGADLISLTPIAPFASNKLQSFLQEVITRLRSTTSGTSGSEFIGASAITGVTGTTVRAQLASLKTLLDAEKARIDALTTRVAKNELDITSLNSNMGTHNHDARYMTRSELVPYLQGGDTLVRIEVFTIVSSNNGDGTFTYKLNDGTQRIGTLGENGEQIFTLERGTYRGGLNHVKAFINDTLQRSVVSGGLVEVANNKIALSTPEGAGAEVTVEYFERIGVTGEHSIIYGSVMPPPTSGSVMWFKVVG